MFGPGSGTVAISPDRVARHLVIVIAVLVAASCTGQYLKYFLGHDHVFGLVRLTYLNGEATIPSWYSSSALLACAGVLAVIAALKRAHADRFAWYWFGLAVMFAYLSMDEGARIHELWGKAIKQHFALTGFLRYSWVIPGALLVLAVAATYLRFLWALPSTTRRTFVLAAAVFVGGALGVEMMSAKHLSVTGTTNSFAHSLLVTLEESAEMLGVIVFLHGLLRYLAAECGLIVIEFRTCERAIPVEAPRVVQALDVYTSGTAAI